MVNLLSTFRTFLISALIVLLSLFSSLDIYAQCSMCKVSAEASLKEGDNIALGLNSGILYLATFPYIIALVMIFLVWRYHSKRKALELKNTSA